ncbi:MAG: hypothetical protein Q7S02_00090 [bacterium]|nr:hypothetical protein [bacterium]
MLFVFAGAGCGSRDTASTPEKAPSAPDDASAAGAGDAVTSWTTYRSDTIGISIPYPEGWYVEENAEEAVTSFYPVQPPNDSDMSPRVWIDRHDELVDEFVTKLDNIQSDEFVQRSGLRMRKIVRRDDLSDDEGFAVSYIWAVDSKTYRIGGRQNDPVFERVVDQVEVLR